MVKAVHNDQYQYDYRVEMLLFRKRLRILINISQLRYIKNLDD